jgi:small redox-active disulfide protein 2
MAEKVVVYGSGCKRCQQLKANAERAVADKGLGISVDYVTDMGEIATKGFMAMPVLEVDGKAVVSGRVPDATEIAALL